MGAGRVQTRLGGWLSCGAWLHHAAAPRSGRLGPSCRTPHRAAPPSAAPTTHPHDLPPTAGQRAQEFGAARQFPAGCARIEAAADLRDGLLDEDSGPLAHAPRPAAVGTVENFYSDTVYSKGEAPRCRRSVMSLRTAANRSTTAGVRRPAAAPLAPATHRHRPLTAALPSLSLTTPPGRSRDRAHV